MLNVVEEKMLFTKYADESKMWAVCIVAQYGCTVVETVELC